jgi:hypothetical protein
MDTQWKMDMPAARRIVHMGEQEGREKKSVSMCQGLRNGKLCVPHNASTIHYILS